MESNEKKEQTRLDLTAVKGKLAGKSGKKYWRSLEEVAETPEFQRFLDDEFPNRSSLAQINRRDLIKFMGASVALAGLSGCRGVFLPEDKVVPYVKQPEELVTGVPLYYASTVVMAGYGTGVLVEQHEGRPIMLSGNPDHPASLGSLDIFSQSETLSFYDPDRPTAPMHYDLTEERTPGEELVGDESTWPDFTQKLEDQLKEIKDGSRIRVLTGTVTSPTLTSLIQGFLAKHPGSRWHAWEPVGQTNAHLGTAMAYSRPLNTAYDFSQAKVIVALDSDFLSPAELPGSLRYARQFANGRRVMGSGGDMNRLYAFESTPGLVGMIADHRWPVRAADVFGIAMQLASELGVPGAQAGSVPAPLGTAIKAIADNLKENSGACIVVAGPHQPAQVHALALAINAALGSIGKTVIHTEPVESTAVGGAVQDLKTLVADMNAGAVDALFIVDSNPGYTAPADLPFADAIKKVKFKVQLGNNEDETTDLVDWHLPMSLPLESWGDVRAFDGTASIIQPVIVPLFDSRSPLEFFALLAGKPASGYNLLRDHWRGKLPGDFEKSWRKVLNDGVIANTSATPVQPPAAQLSGITAPPMVQGTEVVFRADPSIYDGRFANNGWLQEVPKPLSKVTWDNAIYISPDTALKVGNGGVVSDDLVSLQVGDKTIVAPVFVQPGHANDSVTVHLGFGRTRGGIVATVRTEREGGGFNAYTIRNGGVGYIGGAVLSRVGGQYELASTQGHSPLNGDRIIDERDVIRDFTLAEFKEKLAKGGEEPLKPEDAPSHEDIAKQNLFPEQVFVWDGPQWGMSIDMNTCIGCNACVVACQAENNIPVVGKEQVARHREMHWIRIDRYYSGTDENPQATWQPVMCVHCELAPCEPVCPVAATVHSHEGLNQMIYNRCVGTRYCSNNCPYKVRRFNYLNYSDNQPNFTDRLEGAVFNQSLIPGPFHTPHKTGTELLRLMNNPDVSVRGRGVMEKCTYCVQRINAARIEAKKAGRDIRDGEIVTACQQACPTKTIVFGNVADKNSAVSKIKADPRAYLLLEEVQTRPRTSHLARLRNPNPAIPATNTEAQA
ncbi:MAG TPA: TAT-variant-translocated molybdopterin oxidoreductase [Fimbriimonas sp.]|nr:TAT-variant-translocated molybdopterin oxidoreductase [Fimbriimonas sp.]